MDPNSYDKDLTASQGELPNFLTDGSFWRRIRLSLRKLTAGNQEEQEYYTGPSL